MTYVRLLIAILIGLLYYVHAESEKKLNLDMLSRYTMSNFESLYALGAVNGPQGSQGTQGPQKIPTELVEYSCRAFPKHTRMHALCRKFFGSYGTHILDEITRQNQVLTTGGEQCPIQPVHMQTKVTMTSKIEKLWEEVLKDSDMKHITEELDGRISQVVSRSQNNYCSYCVLFVTESQEYLKRHRDNIEDFLIQLCKKSPSRTIEQVCYVSILVYGPQLVDMILKQSPQKVCGRFCENPTISYRPM